MGEDWFWDATFPMGIRSGCAVFEAFSSAVQFLAERRGCGPMSHVLDDFLWISLNQQGAQQKLKCFKKLCEVLGHTHSRAQDRVRDYAGILRNRTRYHQDGGPLARRETEKVSGVPKKTWSIQEDNSETVRVINRPIECCMLGDSSRKTIHTQNVFSHGRDEEAPTVFHTEANQGGAAGHERHFYKVLMENLCSYRQGFSQQRAYTYCSRWV